MRNQQVLGMEGRKEGGEKKQNNFIICVALVFHIPPRTNRMNNLARCFYLLVPVMAELRQSNGRKIFYAGGPVSSS